MSGPLTPARPTPDQARAAVADAVIAVRQLRDAVTAEVPAASRGRADIVRECDAALAAVGDAVRGTVGDDPSLWQRAMAAVDRVIARTGAFLQDVRTMARERIARAWRVTVDAVDATVAKVKEVVGAAYDRLVEKARIAAGILAALVGGSIGLTFSGLVLIGIFAIWYFGRKT